MAPFRFLFLDEKNRIRALKSWHLETNEGTGFQERRLAMARIVASQSILNGRFSRSTCAISNPWVSLVPDKIFEEKNLPAYLNLLLDGGPEKFAFFSEKLPGMPIRLVWAAEKDVVFFCQNNFPTTLLRHSASGIIESWKGLASPYAPRFTQTCRGKRSSLPCSTEAICSFSTRFHITVHRISSISSCSFMSSSD